MSPSGRGLIALVVLLVARPGRAAPYREPQRAMRDSLAFWGWSEDGRLFAYETYSFSGGEPTDCSETAALTVVNAASDRVVSDGTVRADSGGPDDKGRCRVPDVQVELARHRDEHLRRNRILQRSITHSLFEATADGWTVALGPGRTARVQLVARDQDRAEVREDPKSRGLSYRLIITVDGARPQEIANPPRPGALHAELDDAIAFTEPGRRFAALCVPIAYAVPHGSWTRWDCRGLAIAP